MATFTIAAPDGRKIKIRADDEATAVRGAQEWARANPAAKKDFWSQATGAAATLGRSIPFVDEAADTIESGVRLATGQAKGPREAWTQARRNSKALSNAFGRSHPIASDLLKGTGLAAQSAPALATGGASAAPQLAAFAARTAPRGLMGASARAASALAKPAVVGGLSAQATGIGGEGTLSERLQTGNDATLPSMALGAVIPAGLSAAGATRRGIAGAGRKTGSVAARLANRATGGQVLDPQREAALRLGEALKADGLGPAEIRLGLETWQRSGASSPALMDLAGENTRALLRSAASKPGAGRNMAVRYADTTTADLQDNAIARTRALTPDERTLPDIEGDITGRITAASALDEVPAGSGGAQVHAALNRQFDTGKAGVDQAYGAARAAAPEAAHLRSQDLPQLSANVREAVRDFHPDDMPSVARELDGLDTLSTPTVRDLFEARQRLSAVRASKPDQALAASRAVRALDTEIEDAVQRGAVTGDPDVVAQWRTAIAARRDFGRQFEGDDLTQKLTDRGLHGEGRTNLVAPEDATAALIGRNGVSPRPDLHRDLARIRDQLGPDSPEWAAFQRESSQRVLGRDAGTEDFGAAWQTFERQNPELAALLSAPEQQAALAASRQQIGEAVADRGALEAGRSVMRAAPDRLAADMAGLGQRQPLAQVGAAREIEDLIGRPAEGSTGLLNRLSSGTNPGRNLGEVFGPDEGAMYQDAISREIDRVANARFVSPNSGSQTAPRLQDDALIDLPPLSKAGILKAVIDKVRRGVTLTDAERSALLELGTTRVRTEGDIPAIPVREGVQRLIPPAQRARIARMLAAGEGARRASN